MKRLASAVMAVFAPVWVSAQDLPQAHDPWFTDAQARLEQQLAVQPNTRRARNIILMISDGNGVGTNYATRLFLGQSQGGYGDEAVLPYEAFPYLALAKTYNVNAQTPDSAATATAIMTGVKTRFGVVSANQNVLRGDCASLPGNTAATLNQVLSAHGRSTGIVTTTRITHATPATAYAHSADRNFEHSVPEGCTQQTDIARQLVAALESGVIDVALGGGRRGFIDNMTTDEEGQPGKRGDGLNLIARARDAGVHYVWDQAGFDTAPRDGTPVLGLFESSHMRYEADRDNEPSLAEMTAAAIEMLRGNEDGFFLQVEAGRVDHANHAGNLAGAVSEGLAFARAVEVADAMTDDTDTLIIVTADHEHSLAFNGYCGRGSNIMGLCMGISETEISHTGQPNSAHDGKPYSVAGYLNGEGSILTEVQGYSGARPPLDEVHATDPDYRQQALIPRSSETHSGEDVAVYAKGPFAHLLGGTVEQNLLFHVMLHAATAK